MGMLTVGSLCTVLVCISHVLSQTAAPEQLYSTLAEAISIVEKQIGDFQDRLEGMSYHMFAQDVYFAENVRSNGHSGIKLQRLRSGGSRPYDLASHQSNRIAGLHNHANFERTIGLGELTVVMNGVEFRTRHLDYILHQPSTNVSGIHESVPITFPDIPPEVTNQSNVDAQITEMREWFKAWRDQNYSVRDYRKYFRPVLCYMEGAWYYPSGPVDISPSDRHTINSDTHIHALRQFKYTADSGRKGGTENIAFMPRNLNRVVNGTPEYAQWNYRSLCQPLADDLPLNRFRVIDELAPRMRYRDTFGEHKASMRARFQLNPRHTDSWGSETNTQYELLDYLMGQVPGLDNHGAEHVDDAMESIAYKIEKGVRNSDKTPLNAAQYHRMYMEMKRGAFGVTTRRRGFNDNNLFVSLNTREEVVPTEVESCDGHGIRRRCIWRQQKYSYAIPLEIIYLTPLTKWNPCNIKYKGHPSTQEGKTVMAGRRTGTMRKPFNGTNSVRYFITPDRFYEGEEVAPDPADTTPRAAQVVLNRYGKRKKLRASGHRIFLPEIPGVGMLRQRYPIMPVYGEGSSAWKELEALKDIVLDPTRHANMIRNIDDEDAGVGNGGMTFELTAGDAGHSHMVHISREHVRYLENAKPITVETEFTNGHKHNITIEKLGTVKSPTVVPFKQLEPSDHHEHEYLIIQSTEEDVGMK